MSAARIGAGSLVTVCLPHYNCAPWVERAIRSVLGQTLRRLTLVVVDDASAQRAELAAVLRGVRDERVVALGTSRTVGPYRIANRLLPHIGSPFVAFQDADDWSDPQRLEALLGALRDGAWDILGSHVRGAGERGEPRALRQPPPDVNAALAWRCRGGVIYGATTLCRTGLLQQLGGYDGTTRFGADTDLAYRAVFVGRVGNLPRELYHVTVRDGSLTTAPESGLASQSRRAYRASIRRRFYRNLARSWLGRLRPADLRAPANDLPFHLRALGECNEYPEYPQCSAHV